MSELLQKEKELIKGELEKFAKKNKTFSGSDLMNPFLTQISNSAITGEIDVSTADEAIKKLNASNRCEQSLKNFIEKECQDIIQINENNSYTYIK